MKKSWFSISVTLLVVVMLLAIATPRAVNAKAIIETPDIAEGTWIGGVETPLVLTGSTYPDWLQVMNSNAVKLTSAGQICHPFRGGQFGWVASIRQLIDGKWVKLPTTQGWMGNEEGSYMACTNAPRAGTYALFGYFDQTKAPAVSFDEAVCEYSNWDAHIWYTYDDEYAFEVTMGSDPSVFPVGQTVTYTLLDWPVDGLTIAQTGTTTSWDDGEIYATFFDQSIEWTSFSTQVLVETGGCSQVLNWNSGSPNVWGGPRANNNLD
jgi:hypothetical protein